MPGGSFEKEKGDTSLVDTVIRETKEEAGVRVQKKDLAPGCSVVDKSLSLRPQYRFASTETFLAVKPATFEPYTQPETVDEVENIAFFGLNRLPEGDLGLRPSSLLRLSRVFKGGVARNLMYLAGISDQVMDESVHILEKQLQQTSDIS